MYCFLWGIFYYPYFWFYVHNVSLSLATFKILSSSLILSNLVPMYLSIVFFMFLKLRIHWASWMYSFHQNCNILCYHFFNSFSVFSHLEIPIMCVLGCLISHSSLMLVPFFLNLLFSLFHFFHYFCCYVFMFTNLLPLILSV